MRPSPFDLVCRRRRRRRCRCVDVVVGGRAIKMHLVWSATCVRSTYERVHSRYSARVDLYSIGATRRTHISRRRCVCVCTQHRTTGAFKHATMIKKLRIARVYLRKTH